MRIPVTTTTYEMPAVGLHLAQLVDIFDIGHKKRGIPTESRPCRVILDDGTMCPLVSEYPHQFRWTFQLEAKKKSGFRFEVSPSYVISLNEKSNLYKMLANWLGKPMTEDECAAFDPESMIGRLAYVNIVHNGTWANIGDSSKLVMPAPANAEPWMTGYIRRKDRPPSDKE